MNRQTARFSTGNGFRQIFKNIFERFSRLDEKIPFLLVERTRRRYG
ncbi:hypothetical protein HMPREF9141_0745 [Prevotella multiformis DSM 16608]|uniref:Uncharacterized protein n=1 Tax=Prevotella multiformis DSM 16608 TaxID=888743 RepID=F0F579_9BACT|nr:hypothetical protein HMPREF9141_0745 [Prevotella multiformis DSM 16608]